MRNSQKLDVGRRSSFTAWSASVLCRCLFVGWHSCCRRLWRCSPSCSASLRHVRFTGVVETSSPSLVVERSQRSCRVADLHQLTRLLLDSLCRDLAFSAFRSHRCHHVTSPMYRPVLPFTVLWLWYAPGFIVCRVCSTDAFTADVDYQLLIVCMVACRPEPDVLNFSHIVIDIQYTFIIHYLHINSNRPHHCIILSLPLAFPNS